MLSARGRGGRTPRGSGRGRGGGMNGFINKKPKFFKYKNADILLTDDIYPNGPPAAAQGKFFHYHVMSYTGGANATDEQATYTLRYENRMIDPEGFEWISFAAAETGSLRDEMTGVKYVDVVSGAKRFGTAISRITTKNLEEEKKIKSKLKAAKSVNKTNKGEVDVSDIDTLFNMDEMGGKTNKVMDLEFELTGVVENNKRQWRHKRIKSRTFWQYPSSNKNKAGEASWDTGIWTKQLRHIAENKKGVNGDFISIERAKYILKFRLDNCEDALTKVRRPPTYQVSLTNLS